MKPQEFLDGTRCASATARMMFELLCRTRSAITEVGKLPIPEAGPVRAYLVQRAKKQTEAYRSHLQHSGVELPVPGDSPVDPAEDTEGSPDEGEPVAILSIEGGNLHHVETRYGTVVEVSDYDKHSNEPMIVRRYRGAECISRRVED